MTLSTAALPPPFRALGVSTVLGYFIQLTSTRFPSILLRPFLPFRTLTLPLKGGLQGCFGSVHVQSITTSFDQTPTLSLMPAQPSSSAVMQLEIYSAKKTEKFASVPKIEKKLAKDSKIEKQLVQSRVFCFLSGCG